MRSMNDIVTRPSIQKRVTEIHDIVGNVLKDHVQELSRTGNLDKFDLLFACCLPDALSTANVLKLREYILQCLKNGKQPQFTQLGILDLPKIGVMSKLFGVNDPRFTSRLNKKIYSLTVADLEDVSLCFPSNRPLYGLKLIYMFLANHTKDVQEFRGILPSTTPVRKALKTLFGISGTNPFQLSKAQEEVAQDAGVSAMNLNTALWIYGAEIL